MNEFRQAIIDFLPHFVRSDWSELAGRNFDREIKRSFMADIYDDRIVAAISGEKMRDFFDRFLSR